MLLCQCLVVLSHPFLESDRLTRDTFAKPVESSSISLLFGKKWNMLPSTHINNHLYQPALPCRLHSSWLYLRFIMVSQSLALFHDPGKNFSLYKVRRKIITCVIQQHASEVFQWPYWCFQFWWNNKMLATAQPRDCVSSHHCCGEGIFCRLWKYWNYNFGVTENNNAIIV